MGGEGDAIWGEPLAVSPEALHQSMHKRAVVFLQDMIRQALAKVQALEKVCEDGLFAYFPKGSVGDSTGFELPESLKALLPGSGGRAAQAGAKMQAGWDDTRSVCGHGALTPWNIPDQQSLDNLVA